jgi:anti-sigma factor RsiW
MRIRGHLRPLREPAPGNLLDRVRASLEMEVAGAQTGAPPDAKSPARFLSTTLAGLQRTFRPHVPAIAAALLACAICIPVTLQYAQRAAGEDRVAQEALAAHVRSLLQDNAVQVASLDTHTVKPWFAGQVEFTPVVKDLAAEGFKLIGGRLDYVDGHRVATLVYRRRLHEISVFIWPARAGSSTSGQITINGYNLVAWNRAGMTYWAVSDLNAGELRELESLL